MRIFEILRMEYGKTETIGVLSSRGTILGFTLELPWKQNGVNVSCIAPGEYKIREELHKKHGRCLRLAGVPGRAGVLIHAGNTAKDTRGCIIPGMLTGKIVGSRAVLNSHLALDSMLDIVASAGPDLTIAIRAFVGKTWMSPKELVDEFGATLLSENYNPVALVYC